MHAELAGDRLTTVVGIIVILVSMVGLAIWSAVKWLRSEDPCDTASGHL
jgi:hypothetical protein